MSDTPKIALSLDFGGTKLACAIVNTDLGKIVNYTYMANKTKTAKTNIDEMLAMADWLLSLDNEPISCVGVSFGGIVRNDGSVISDHIPGYEDLNLHSILEEKFKSPVYLANDCNAAVLGEWYYGAGKDKKDCIYVQLSTGIGCGIIIDGKLYSGSGNAGELGHVCVDDESDELCVCGNKGCLENFISGWGLKNRAKKYWDKVQKNTFLAKRSNNNPENVSAEMIFAGAKEGDAFCKFLTDTAVKKLGLAISHIINIWDPSLIVFGGGISGDFSYFIDDMKKVVSSHVFGGDISHCEFKKSTLKGNAPLLGASILNIMNNTD